MRTLAFVSKILKKLVKTGVLSSSKGNTGGFTVNEATKDLILLRLFRRIYDMDTFNKCSLRLQECHTVNPCPLHMQMDDIRQRLK